MRRGHGLQHQQEETERSHHTAAEDWGLTVGGFTSTCCLCCSEVMTCLHCLNVRDQGPRQEDAEDLKPKPKVSGVNKGGAEELVGTACVDSPHLPYQVKAQSDNRA